MLYTHTKQRKDFGKISHKKWVNILLNILSPTIHCNKFCSIKIRTIHENVAIKNLRPIHTAVQYEPYVNTEKANHSPAQLIIHNIHQRF